MVSQNKFKNHNQRLVKFFLDKAYKDSPTIEQLISDNVISGTQLSEIAISNTCGIKLDPIGEGRDLQDNSDVKTGTVCMITVKRGDNTYYVPKLNVRCKNKIGLLRIIAYNPFFDSWYFFKVPQRIHKGRQNLWLLFCQDTGKPKGKYARFQIDSWEEFCRR